MKYSIYYKILMGYLIFAAFSLILINTLISSMASNMVVEREANKLYSHSVKISTYYSNYFYDIYNNTEHSYENDMEILSAPQNVTIWIVGTKNDILYSTTPEQNPKKLPSISKYFGSSYYTTGDFNGSAQNKWLTVYSPIVNNYQTYGYIMMNIDMETIQNEHLGVMNMVNIAFIIIFVLSMIILFIFSVFVYKPLIRITKASKEYAKGNYEYDGLKILSHDEMRNLSDALQFMAKSFQNIYASQKKFIANISHDFRSPLTSIKGYVTAMLDGTIPVEMQEKYLHIVLSETERLTKLTGSLLTLNTLDSNGMILDIGKFDIIPMIKDTIASFEGQCNTKSLKIKFFHEDKDYTVNADSMRIQQVIYNLIDNAIKFSPNNADIIVDISDKNDKIFVSVKDFGIGISSENQLKIWDRFFKVDDSRGRDKRGTGLGLAIVKEIITAHNENITVISTEGVGTQFTFSVSKVKK